MDRNRNMFPKEDIEVANTLMKKCSIPVTFQKTQFEVTTRCHFTLTKMAIKTAMENKLVAAQRQALGSYVKSPGFHLYHQSPKKNGRH